MAEQEGIRYILANAPFGGLEEIIEDESSDAFRKGVREHLESHAYLLAKGEDKIIVSANSFQSVNEEIATYIDHFSNKHYNVSLSTRKLESVDEIDEGDRDEASYGCLQLIGSSVKQYLAEFFSASSTVIVLFKGNNLVLEFASKTLNPGSSYNGYWNSSWTVNVESNKMEGKVVLYAHLFEEGNIFFNDEKTESVDLEKKLLSSPKEFAEEVVTQVMGIERKLVKRLQQHFEEEVEECCKAVRLALPRTMSKIDWDINLNNVVAQLNHPIK